MHVDEYRVVKTYVLGSYSFSVVCTVHKFSSVMLSERNAGIIGLHNR